jgi:hypothetical protein
MYDKNLSMIVTLAFSINLILLISYDHSYAQLNQTGENTIFTPNNNMTTGTQSNSTGIMENTSGMIDDAFDALKDSFGSFFGKYL